LTEFEGIVIDEWMLLYQDWMGYQELFHCASEYQYHYQGQEKRKQGVMLASSNNVSETCCICSIRLGLLVVADNKLQLELCGKRMGHHKDPELVSLNPWTEDGLLTYELSGRSPDTIDLDAIGGVKGSCLMTAAGEVRLSSPAS
jgi:hypothetical protein